MKEYNEFDLIILLHFERMISVRNESYITYIQILGDHMSIHLIDHFLFYFIVKEIGLNLIKKT